jgi:FkbM family methyltransferase
MGGRILELENKILEIFKHKKNGYFVDIGAYDGFSISNTKILEDLGWDGVCIEPHPNVYKELIKNRNCECVNCAIWNEDSKIKFLSLSGYTEMLSGIFDSYDSRHYNRIMSELKTYGGQSEIIEIDAKKFDSVVQKTEIDFLSIDTEGSELQILNNIDFDKYQIKVICVENNFHESSFNDFFLKKGYSLYGNVNIDYLYIKL